MTVIGKLRELGYDPAEDMSGRIEYWRSWYNGNVDDFHNYKVWNGANMVNCRRFSAGMGKKVCEDWADLLLNEKVGIAVNGEAEQLFIDDVLEKNNFRVKGNEMQERKAALGTVAYVLNASGVQVDAENGELNSADRIQMDYCTAEAIHPLSWSNGRVLECAFSSECFVDGKAYIYLQIHHLTNGLYDIDNRLYLDGEAVPLVDVRGFEQIPPVVHTNSNMPQFVIDRLNIANPSIDSPMGISVLANAIDQLKGVDIAYDSYINEFVLGKKRVMVKSEATKDLNGRPFFDPNDTVYYVLPEDTGDGILIEQVDMPLRIQEHNAGLQDMLNMLSSKCGLGENRYRYDQGSVSTATQVISENSALFRTLKKHELILREALTTLCRTILRMGNAYMGMALNEDVEITIDFDDSIIEDTDSILKSMKSDADAGYIRPEIYLARKYGVTEKEALSMMPSMEDLTTEEQDEIE